jgi:hypothetical protein
MDLTTLPKFYQGQDLQVTYQVHEEDGTTALDMTGGTVGLELFRNGMTPFSFEFTSDDGTRHEWVNRALGQGRFMLPLSEEPEPLPAGLCRIQLTSTTADNRFDVQAIIWVKIEQSF